MKRVFYTFMTFIFVFIMSVYAMASSVSQQFISFVEPFYFGDSSNYFFYDQGGNDITRDILEHTSKSAHAGDWAAVYDYVSTHCVAARQERETARQTKAGGYKSKTSTCYALVKGVSGTPSASSYSRNVLWDITATIYYDSTNKITSTSSVNTSNEMVLPVGMIRDRYSNCSIAPDKASATFYSSVVAAEQSSYGDFFIIVYKKAYGQMTITV